MDRSVIRCSTLVCASTILVTRARFTGFGDDVCLDLDALDRWVGIEPWHG
jgi:hypothetical protein